MNQKACYTDLPHISCTVCISRTTQSRSELSAELTGVNVEVGSILFCLFREAIYESACTCSNQCKMCVQSTRPAKEDARASKVLHETRALIILFRRKLSLCKSTLPCTCAPCMSRTMVISMYRNSPSPKVQGGVSIGGVAVEAEFVH